MHAMFTIYNIQWLENDFLKYINEWESCAQAQTDLPANDRKKICLSEETIEGLNITGICTPLFLPL